ncbi:hypothetical protein UFOVP431_20 [uncultured Caudovirales phage]|uniref:Uncharacterized protein n=1 Tax=uncultured Caudovirales phage TaxID=2100421 RepID=A0A6J5ML16_9CAUD|nr:hypothetical protein UFOVP431_20 [uncultured Caudovirales phage]
MATYLTRYTVTIVFCGCGAHLDATPGIESFTTDSGLNATAAELTELRL